MHLADVAHQSTVFVGGTVDDIVEAHRSGRIAMVPCMEGAAMIENELDRLDVLFGLGVRMCGIAYSESNQLGGGVKDPGDGGLTRFGIDAVRRMNRLGRRSTSRTPATRPPGRRARRASGRCSSRIRARGRCSPSGS
jgi:membrane dipeptidase